MSDNGFCPDWIADNLDRYVDPFWQHVYLTLVSVAIGFAIAFALALLAHRRRWLVPPITQITGILYTLPSLAVFFLLLPLTGRGNTTAIIALVAYTLLIIFRNVISGLDNVPVETRDAGRGMGLTDRQLLWRVELPLALPEILAGLRIAVTTTVGLGDAGLLRRRRRPRRADLRRHHLQVERRRRGRRGGAAGGRARRADPARPARRDSLDAGPGDGMILAFLSDFADAIDFIFNSRESREGTTVGGSQFLELTWEHLKLSLAAMAIAAAIAVPLGLWLGHIGKGGFLAINASNVGRAVPSLALIAFFVAYLGVGFTNVTAALVLLAIPPILTNTYVGVRQVDPETVDAARGTGMTGVQIVRGVELPLSVALIFGGLRISTVNVIATATIAPLAGVNTLGDPIINASVYGDAGRLGAAIVVAALAVFAEVALGAVQRAVTPRGLKLASDAPSRRRFRVPNRGEATA